MTENPSSLFILVHGLLGSHKHMHAIRDLILAKEANSLVLIPCKNTFFKTFDGIELVGDRVVSEIKVFLKTRSEREIQNLRWINFVSYSMGGLISRYVIGEMSVYLEKRYPNIRFNAFMAFASPHLGVNFFRDGEFPYNILTILGSNVLGRSGKQLFLDDSPDNNESEKLLVRISKGKYLAALKKFNYRICLSNVHNDRSVAFYTSFITHMTYSCDLNTLEEDTILCDWAKFPSGAVIDVTRPPISATEASTISDQQHMKARFSHAVKYMGKICLIGLFLVFIFPIVLVINIAGTSWSHVNVWFYRNRLLLLSKLFFINKHWLSKRLDIDLDDEFDDESEMDQLIEVLSSHNVEGDSVESEIQQLLVADWELKKNTYQQQLEQTPVAEREQLCFRYFIEKYIDNNGSEKFKHSLRELPFVAEQKEIYDNLNTLKWIRVPYKLTGTNTHRAIVARNGLESTSAINRKSLEFNVDLLMEVCRYGRTGVAV